MATLEWTKTYSGRYAAVLNNERYVAIKCREGWELTATKLRAHPDITDIYLENPDSTEWFGWLETLRECKALAATYADTPKPTEWIGSSRSSRAIDTHYKSYGI